ncbi:hypothetical protein [Risungbinella massiliensis]|uniref:hypothetical protein n=1 Tax=Risungbinella massiliensis TaxID=1329796 RepID=UPI0005CBAC5A|nr:hypothetical protein [Risungbinella massiliensis]
MKKPILASMILATAVMISGCAEETEPITSQMKQMNEQSDVLTTPVVEENFQSVEQSVQMNILTPAEKAAYQSFQKSKSDAALQKLEPVSIAKLYIQAKKDRDYATLYALHQDPKAAASTLEQFETEEKTKSAEYDTFLAPFAGISKVNILTSGDQKERTNVQYQLPDQTQFSFHLQKTDKGVWKFLFPAISAN